ncbi:recombinase family protein [Salmonella enterica]|nr:recombinase family protein [Salmonella enterica]
MDCVIYMRASTEEQDASRAEDELKAFAAANGLTICGWYKENVSGTQLERPQLNKLLNDAGPGFVLLVEKIDRLSRLTRPEWEQLKERIRAKRLRIVCRDLPTTLDILQAGQPTGAGGFDVRGMILDTISAVLIDLAAAWARDDYETRRKRQAQGIKKAVEAGKYKGKQPNTALHKKILKYAAAGHRPGEIARLAGCSRSTVLRVTREQ